MAELANIHNTHIRLAELKNAQGNELYKLGKYSNAIYLYESAIKLNPNEAKYHSNQSACYINQGEILKAQASAQKAIDIDETNLKGYLRVIKCCLIMGNLQHAATTLKTALKKFQTNEDLLKLNESVIVLQTLYDTYHNKIDNKEYEAALAVINECLQEKPDCISFMLEKAKCLTHLQQFEAAKLLANEISKVRENDDVNYIQACADCYKLTADEALPLIKKIKEENPDHYQINELYINTKLICENIEKIEEAITLANYGTASKLIQKTIKIDPNYIETIKQLKLRKISMASDTVKYIYQKNLPNCNEFLTIYEPNLDILKMKANILIKLHQYEESIKIFEEITKLEKNDFNEMILTKARRMLELGNKDSFKMITANFLPDSNDNDTTVVPT